jgi:hypothetical protein
MLAARGETFFVSSGDHGKYCDNSSTAITGPQYPASDPLVTAVGGTNLLLNTDNSYAAEYAWSESGGGSSTYSWNKRPSWQRGTGIPAGGQRLVPDVSAEAFCSLSGCRGHRGYDYDITGPGTSYPNAALGFSVRTRCKSDAQCWISDGGTSLASPIWASIAAIYNQYAASAGQTPLNANVNAQLYHMAFTDRHPGGPITDVTSQAESGADLYQNSGRGWDGATGVGSPQLYAMATASGGQLSFANQYQMLGTPGLTTPALDCAAANFCLAVGTGGEVHYYNGSAWSENQYGLSYANSVSCASTAFCAAASYDGVYVSTVSGSWNHFYASGTFSPRYISCPAVGQCVVTGVNAAQKTAYAVLSGGKMGTPKTITGDPVPIGIACSSAQFCLGVGQISPENVSDTFNGSTWTAPQKLGPVGDNAEPTCVPNGSCYAAGGSNTYQFSSAGRTSLGSLAGQNFTAIACPADLACTGATASGHVASYNGTAWTLGQLVAPRSFLATLSCPATTFCVGQSYQGYSSYFNGTAWSAMSRTDPDGFVMSVSCPTATFCGAFDGEGEVSFFHGSHWSAPVMLDPVINGYQDGSISCVSATFCALVDSNRRAFTYNGSQWSSGTSIIPASTFINSVSCASPAMCVAIDFNGDVYGFNGKTWRFTHATGLVPAGYLPAVSCPTTKFCMAVGGDQAEEYTGGSWEAAKQVAPASAELHAVSCVSASYCLAGDRETGDLFTYHNGKWGRIKQAGVLTDATSCFGTESCVVLGDIGADYVDGTTVSGLNVPGEPNVEDLGASCPSARRCFVTSGGEISW